MSPGSCRGSQSDAKRKRITLLEKGLFEEYEKCLQDEPAATTARCPVHMDVPEFCATMAAGNFTQAYTVLQKRIPFAGVMCLACDAPCEEACVRGALDAPVRMGELERAAVRYGYTPFKKKFKTSKKGGRVAVVGGGISGLSAAFDLDRRGYAVTLYEQSNQLGGWLWQLLGEKLEESDLKQGLQAISELAIEVKYGQFIDTLRLQQLQSEYAAVFLGTGFWTEALSVDANTFRVGATNLFAGGTLAGTGDSLIGAVSSGKRAAITMERFIKNISLTAEREREGAFTTRLPKSLEYVVPNFGSAPGDGFKGVEGTDEGIPDTRHTDAPDIPNTPVAFDTPSPCLLYTREEAQREASRCLLCECDECIKACVHMQRYERKPKTYARSIYTNENVFLGTRYANKMINSCTLCGLCGQRCPIDLSMAPLVRQTRRSMVAADKMPPSAHDFALRDMAFSLSDQFFFVGQPPVCREDVSETEVGAASQAGIDSASQPAPWMFFPGCQLAASEPEHVEAAYAWLRKSFSEGVSLMLGCCGAPADWAGRDDLLAEALDKIRSAWEAEGKPTLILACSSCKDVFSRCLPDIPTISLWQVLDKAGVGSADETQGQPLLYPSGNGKRLNLHDACSTRHDAALQQSVRSLLSKLDYTVDELRYSEKNTKCCGYGGLVFYANREQEGDFAADRARESPHDLVVYCAMCKDFFIDAGKRSFHLLDLLFAEDPEDYALKRMPSLSERQANRAELKRRLLAKVWGSDELDPAVALPGYEVVIPPDILDTMDERLILTTDVEDALAYAVANPDERFYHTEDDCYLINIRKQYVTYWVRYAQKEHVFTVLSTYSHRMDIES